MTMLSVVFSFRNEEAVLPELVSRVRKAVLSVTEDFELIFVDDDSSDSSLALLQAEHRSDPRIKVITMSRQFGVGPCIMAGLAQAVGDAVIYMDADLQDPPELIPELVAAWRAGAEVVHTRRIRRHGEERIKIVLTHLAYKLIGLAATVPLPYEAGDFKLLSRRVVTHLVSLEESDPFVRGLVAWVGFRQAFVDYERAARLRGATHFPLWSSNPWKTFVWGITSLSFAPIYAVLAVSVAGLLGAAVLGIAGLIAAAANEARGMVYWLVTFGVFCWATILLSIGIIGIYLARIYKDVRARPNYIIRSTVPDVMEMTGEPDRPTRLARSVDSPSEKR